MLGPLESADLPIVDDICRRLDGLPLALELAAARLTTMSLEELDQRLDDRFRLLTRRRGAVARQQSLRTTVSWSYDLLSAEEQVFFDRLSVFAGGFDLDAALAVCAEGLAGDPEALLASLVDKSLLTVQRGATTRFLMLETLRQFGEERLVERGESLIVRRRHLDHFLRWIERANAGVTGPDELRWHHAYLAELHNVRNAHGWACTIDDGDAACRLVHRMHSWAGWRFWIELADWAAATLMLPSTRDHPLRPSIAALAGHYSYLREGPTEAVQRYLVTAHDAEERLGVHDDVVVPYFESLLAWELQPFDAVLRAAREACRRADTTGDDYLRLGADIYLAWMETQQLEVHQAAARPPDDLRRDSDRQLAQARARGNPSLEAYRVAGARAPPGRLRPHRRHSRPGDDVGARRANRQRGRRQHHAQHPRTASTRPTTAPWMPSRSYDRRSTATGAATHSCPSGSTCPAALRAFSVAGRPDVAALLLGRNSVDANADLVVAAYDLATVEGELRAALGDSRVDQLLDEGRRLSVRDMADLMATALDELLS